MNPDEPFEEEDGDSIFTQKQCHVLDLLIEHKTSKEIARALGISPYTVDQRISLARAKLGVSSRNELAARYRAMRENAGQTVADTLASAQWERPIALGESDAGTSSTEGGDEDSRPRRFRRNDDPIAPGGSVHEEIPCPTASNIDYRVGPEVFEGSSGGLWRVGAVVATALLLVVTILGLFAIFNQLNDMLS